MNLVIVQARLGSSRFPNKILSGLGDGSILDFVIKQIKKAKLVDKIVIATTQESIDDFLVDYCLSKKYDVFRGSELDLLDRHFQCAKKYNPTSISKIPSDVPFVDPEIINKVIKCFCEGDFDYVSNLHPPTFPDGLDVETFSFESLTKTWKITEEDYEREHTTPYIWDNPDSFKIGSITADQKKNYFMDYRWTIDYEEDLEFMRAVYKGFIEYNPNYHWLELVEFLDNNPSIASINRKYNGVNWYGKYINVLKNFDKRMTRHDA